ncbi:MAG: Fis family transcriptional regulator [Methylococcaceae bacterium]|nr:Fis family transcriptional regulator [Methylococcaceae bacterium]
MESKLRSAKVLEFDSMKQKPIPLSAQVNEAVDYYFSQLNGDEICGLHAMVISEVEKPLIETTLAYCGQNQTKASKLLGLSRSTLRKKIALYDLS